MKPPQARIFEKPNSDHPIPAPFSNDARIGKTREKNSSLWLKVQGPIYNRAMNHQK